MNAFLNDDNLTSVLAQALREDVGLGDITTDCTVPADLQGQGILLAKANGILSGIDVAATVFAMADSDLRIEISVQDGMPLLRGMQIAKVSGCIASMLTAERVALNFLQRMSGIATMTAGYMKLVDGLDVRILDTRITAPCLRAFDKMAVRHGRGTNHRFGLDDMVLIKDNHIAAAGGLKAAVEAVVARLGENRRMKVEVETDTLLQVTEALSCPGVDIIMLDNFLLPDIAFAVDLIRRSDPSIKIEVSGNVTEQTVRDIAECGVDMISVGALTHSVKALDISFDIGIGEQG
jgi:nicotinate-nucleotide pyrophosphorylase (carboxylating)